MKLFEKQVEKLKKLLIKKLNNFKNINLANIN